MHTRSLLVLCSLVLTACAGFYPQPEPSQPHAVVQGTSNRHLDMGAVHIDGQRRFPVRLGDPHRVAPGKHAFEIEFYIIRGPCGKADIALECKAGHVYQENLVTGPAGFFLTITDVTTQQIVASAPGIIKGASFSGSPMDDANAIMMGAMSSKFR